MAKSKRWAPAAAMPPPAATAPKVKWSAPAAAIPPSAHTTPVGKGITAAAAIVIEIPSSPDHSEGGAKGGSGKKARKRSAPPLYLDDEIEMWTPREKRRLDEDCKTLPGDPLAVAKIAPAAGGNDDIVIVAESGKVACRDFPHPRSVCARNPFTTTPHERYCDKCFCYVCDIAAPCAFWRGSEGHCHASDKDKKWKTMRRQKQKK